MATTKIRNTAKKTLANLEIIKGTENLLIEKEKRYQTILKKNRRPQVEKQTLLKETKKKPAQKITAKKK